MSDFDNSGMKEKSSSIGVTTVWLILTMIVLVVIGSFFGYHFFKETLELNNRELALWFLFMLFAAAISCIFGAITSHFSQKSEEKREKSIVQKIKIFLTEKTDEITSAVALRQTDFVSGKQNDILDKLMNCCLETDEKIDRIMILAQDSGSFIEFFTTHFADVPFECNELEILIHDHSIKPDHDIIKKWDNFYKSKEIEYLRIRKTNELKQRAFFGIIIKFQQGHHSIGMIGFYEPQIENGVNRLNPFNKRYGVLSEENSILNVLDEYFNRYFDRSEKLKEECKSPSSD